MEILPAVGTVYLSLLAFKLDSFERGLQHSLWLTTRIAGRNLYQYTYCGIQVGPEKRWCTFRVCARKSDGVVRVTLSNETHSCLSSQRRERGTEARKVMAKKVATLRKELEQSLGQSLGQQSAKRVRLGQETYLSAKALEREIEAMKKKGPVSLPSSSQSFDSVKDLLVLLFSHAQQQGFSIHRRSNLDETSRLRLRCSRNMTRYEDRCHYKLTASRDNLDGKWRLLEIVGTHNHGPTRSDHPQSTRASFDQHKAPTSSTKRRKRSISQVSRSDSETSESSSSYSTSRIRTSLAIPRVGNDSSYTASPPPEVISILPSPSASTYPSNLVSFLKSFDSDPSHSTLTATLSDLRTAGVDSLEVLMTVLQLRQETFRRFVNSILGEETGIKLQKMADELRIGISR